MVSLISGLLLIGVGTVILKPQEIPKYARIFGRFCGKSLKMIMEAKASLSKSQDSEVLRMKKEFDFMMSEVATVRSELRKGFNMRGITAGMNTNQQQDVAQQQQQQGGINTPTNDITSQPFMTNESNNNNVQNNAQFQQMPVSSFSHVTPQMAQNHLMDTTTHVNMQYPQMHPQPQFTMPQSTLSTPHNLNQATSSTSSFITAQLHNPFVHITNKKMMREPSFSTAFAELQQLERDSMIKDPSLQYFHVDPSRVNSFDYDSYPLPLSKTQPNLKESPFCVVEFGHQPMEGLYDETSVGIRTEVMGGGADLVSINVLESLVANKR
ncbi:hypothetical protein C9374_002341 [Naegleria lovaniensis]|uniref:Uncharacterized protein n=1 Tax=Naegleria lovaniensis TaxID=51637 RepID=A0AA88GT83_NAELO|nr:uncharacterized protein C9374_002341 [Naegleria lovaniensis]KAG2386597.1 hypothetical protein C9374_002341 [Naegleria lovaniensis]